MTAAQAPHKKRVAVVGAGPAGLACATTLAERGHTVTLFEASSEIGGQFNLAKRIPGKEEFAETLRYFRHRLAATGVDLRLGKHVTAADLGSFDHVFLATGVNPRAPTIPGSDHPSVASYVDIVSGRRQAGQRVAIVGAGGIGFDVAELLTHNGDESIAAFQREWGIDPEYASRGGLAEVQPTEPAGSPPARQVFLLQRKPSKVGDGLAKTTGWIRRTLLKKRGVMMISGVDYERIDDVGLHLRVGSQAKLLEVDTIVICAGQEPRRELVRELEAAGMPMTLIGGADIAAELDAKRAIRQGTEVALAL